MRTLFATALTAVCLCLGGVGCTSKPACNHDCCKPAATTPTTGCGTDCHCKKDGKCCCGGVCKPNCTCTNCVCK